MAKKEDFSNLIEVVGEREESIDNNLVQLNTRIDSRLKDLIRIEAQRRGISMNEYVVQAIKSNIDEEDFKKYLESQDINLKKI